MKEKDLQNEKKQSEVEGKGLAQDPSEEEKSDSDEPKVIVKDRRFWVDKDVVPTDAKKLEERLPTFLERMKTQLGQKDKKLQEVVGSLKEEQENFKKRVERDIDTQVAMAKMKLVSSLLPALDNLGRSIVAAESAHSFDSLMEGIKLVNAQFKDCLKDCGVEEIDSADRPFNPKTDEAVQMVPVEDKEKDNVILACLESGYRLGDKIIKPAKVTVGKAA